jgi:DNA mismatch repair protein MutH
MSLFPTPPLLSRAEAVELLKPYLGQDLRRISDQLGVTQAHEAVSHYGWAGHTVEWLLGSAPNNQQAADFGTWELKVTSVEKVDGHENQTWLPKGQITLTSIQPAELVKTSFEDSHLFEKTKHLLIACRTYTDPSETSSNLVMLCEYDLEGELFTEVKQEYEELQWVLREHGLMGMKDIHMRRLGLKAGMGTRGGARLIARKTWVEEMMKIGLRHEQSEGV